MNGRIYLWLIIGLLFAGCSRDIRAGKYLRKEVRQSDVFRQAFTGLVVRDAFTKEIILSENGDKHFTPASGTKIVTLMTALEWLPDSLASLIYTLQGDSLIFWGTGNPVFLDSRFPKDRVTMAFLSDTTKQLFFSSANFQESPLGSGWAWDDTPYRYSAERSPFPIYENTVRFTYDLTADSLHVDPPYFHDKLAYGPNSGDYQVLRLPISSCTANSFQVQGQPKRNSQKEIPFRVSDSMIIQLLRDTLHKEIQLIHQFPNQKAAKLITTPAREVYRVMMQESDNLLAEQLLLMAAEARTGVMSIDSIIPYVKEDLLTPMQVNNPRWVDGSGLSRYNHFTPKDLVAILSYLLDNHPLDELLYIFPQGKTNGTIKNHYAPYVWAKTGTMSGVHSLSGYLKTKKGHWLIFSFMHNNYRTTSATYKPEMNRLLTWMWEEM